MDIDYNKITKYNRNVEQLLTFLMWCTVTPGKRSDVITPRFNAMFSETNKPQDVIKKHGKSIRSLLEKNGIGQYDRILKAWKAIRNIKPIGQLKTITRPELMTIPGIGPKTASFFIVHSRKWQEIAVLDVHILKHLQKIFPKFDIPDVTPQDLDTYEQVEALFLGLACQLNMSPAQLDTQIWQRYSLSK